MKTENWVYLTLLVCISLLSIRGCTVDKAIAKNALIEHGLDDIEITDHIYLVVGFRGCSNDDAAKFTATGTNQQGDQVDLYVCTGWLVKGATIRYAINEKPKQRSGVGAERRPKEE